MTPRTSKRLLASLLALPLVAFAGQAAAHNGRDAGPKPSPVARSAGSQSGIVVTTDPKTGVRTYSQTGPIAPNPALAQASPGSTGPGIDYWVRQSQGGGGVYAGPTDNGTDYVQNNARHEDGYEDSYAYSDYGSGYLPVYGYGGGNWGGGRPGQGGGGGRPGRPDGGGGGRGDPPRTSGGGYNLPPGSNWSPPPGPRGGGIGSPTPQPPRMNSRGGGRRR